MFKYFRVLCLCLIFLLISKNTVFAVDYFYDNFNERDDSSWVYNCQHFNRVTCLNPSNAVSYKDGAITLSSDSAYFPVVFTKNDVFPRTGDFSVVIRFRYPSVTNRGVGLGIGFTGPYGKLFSQFGIWNDTSSSQDFKFYYNDFDDNSNQGYCSNFTASTDDNLGRQTISTIPLNTDLYWHVLEIRKEGDVYKVFVDKDEQNTPLFTTSIKNNCIPRIIWFGNFIPDGGGDWTTFSLDEVLISNDLSPITPTPIPEEKHKKIFILPGLGASWSSEAIVYGKQVGDNDWKMTPFVNNYDGLIELLKNNGLEENKDFFVWNYDWRKSMSDIENKFNDFVNSKNLDNDDEVYLIGHSLGGVVARLWSQTNLDKFTIKEVIALGSPHLGSLNSYSVWNGGEVLKMDGLSSVAFQILLGLQNKGFAITDINKIRSFAPVLKDLLPTFDYVSKSGKTIPWRNLESKNDYLNGKNQSISSLVPKLSLSVGTGISTPNILKLGSRSVFDKTLGLWPDGELLSYVSSNGDGTVLKNSANLGQSSFYEVASNHGEITNKSINLIADKLGLANKNINFNYQDNFSDSLVVFVGSPAKATLKCGNETFEEKDGFVLVKNRNYQDCDLSLSPTDNGTVHLVTGNTKDNQWQYFEKEVRIGFNENLEINFIDGEITDDKSNADFLKKQIEADLKKISLSKGVKSLDKNELTKVALYVFEYRAKNNERIITQRILDNLFYLAAIVGPDKNKENYKTLSSYVNLMEDTLNFKSKRKTISKNSVLSLVQLQTLENRVKEMVKEKSYPSYSMVLVLSGGYGVEILK